MKSLNTFSMSKSSRLFYIDNLRIFLIALVVLHHLSITYGASGGWYYKEVEGDTITTLLLTLFTATNQSFFMGLFFLISAYFTRISMERKSSRAFLVDRFIRLGIPLILYYFVLSPLTIYVAAHYGRGLEISFIEYVKVYQGFGFGPLWFVETLLYFSLFYALYRFIFKKRTAQVKALSFPKPIVIILFALSIGILSFIVRLWLPLGWELKYVSLQLPYFPQYIAMLILGVLFAKYNWFEKISYKQGLRWFIVAQFFILLILPILFFLNGPSDGDSFSGGWTWQSATLSLWEQLTGFSLLIGLIAVFKAKFFKQGKWAGLLSTAAYAVFIIHPLVIVSLSVLVKDWEIYPILKFALLAPIALFLCFGLGILIKKIPLFKKVL